MGIAKRKHASTPVYISPNQLNLDGFETPFVQQINPVNRWIILACLMPWDNVCGMYLNQTGVSITDRPPISPRIVLGSLIIKHLCNLDDRKTVDQITENLFMQYSLEYSKKGEKPSGLIHEPTDNIESPREQENKGRVIFDATACLQDIVYLTDLNLISDARQKSEQLIDMLYDPFLLPKKQRTNREVAPMRYLIDYPEEKNQLLELKDRLTEFKFSNDILHLSEKEELEKGIIRRIDLNLKHNKLLLILTSLMKYAAVALIFAAIESFAMLRLN